MRSEPDQREGGRYWPSIWPRVLFVVVMAATVIVILVPQGESTGTDLRPLALGLSGLGLVAWLADRRRRQATPARSQ